MPLKSPCLKHVLVKLGFRTEDVLSESGLICGLSRSLYQQVLGCCAEQNRADQEGRAPGRSWLCLSCCCPLLPTKARGRVGTSTGQDLSSPPSQPAHPRSLVPARNCSLQLCHVSSLWGKLSSMFIRKWEAGLSPEVPSDSTRGNGNRSAVPT